MKKILLLSIILLGSMNLRAQKHKIGYINTNQLWDQMPEKAEADSILISYSNEINGYIDGLIREHNRKLSELKNDSSDQNTLLYKEKVKEVQALKQKIADFKKRAEVDIQTKQDSLYTPIRIRMQEAIDKVADKQGYDYILDSSYGNIVFRRDEENNILSLVLKELNITN